MSPTSTERRPRSDAAFRRALAITLAALSVACLLLLGAGYLQGPRLEDAQVDPERVTSADNQQLRLFANQSIEAVTADQVHIEPATPFTVTSEGDLIAVQFGERLRYGTEYSVRVDGVASAHTGRPGTLEYRFTTTQPQFLWLDRGQPDDTILRSTLDGQGGQAVYSAAGIQDFAVVDDLLAVVTVTAQHTNELGLVRPGDVIVENVLLPEEGVIQQLAASAGTLGFAFTSAATGPGQANTSTLYTLDLDAVRELRPVLGLDGQPMEVLGWGFVPGSARIAALTTDLTLVVVDTSDGTVLPLGQYEEFGAISLDGASVIVSNQFAPRIVDLATGDEEPIDPSPIQGQQPFSGASQLLPDGTRLGKALLADDSGTRFSTLLVRDDGTQATIVYRTAEDRGSIGEISISPNGQYVAIETIPDTTVSASDGYYFDARSTSVTTVVVEVATGRQVRSFEGFGLLWD